MNQALTTSRLAVLSVCDEANGPRSWVFIQPCAVKLFREVREAVEGYAGLLFADLWEWINVSSFDCFEDREEPEDGWSCRDVEQELKALLDKRQRELETEPDDASILGEWHDLLGWVSECPGEMTSYVEIVCEGSPVEVVKWIVDTESACLLERVRGLGRYEPQEIPERLGWPVHQEGLAWLGRCQALYFLCSAEAYGQETYLLLWKLIEEYNERYGGV